MVARLVFWPSSGHLLYLPGIFLSLGQASVLVTRQIKAMLPVTLLRSLIATTVTTRS